MMMKTSFQVYLGLMVFLPSLTVAMANETSPTAFQYFQQGDFKKAIQKWEQIQHSEPQTQLAVDDIVLLAQAYQLLGQLQNALCLLKPLVRQEQEPLARANILKQLSEIYLAISDLSEAELLSGNAQCEKDIREESNRDTSATEITTTKGWRSGLIPDVENSQPDPVMQICAQKIPIVRIENLIQAQKYITAAEELARAHSHPLLLANILNTKGNVWLTDSAVEQERLAYFKYAQMAKGKRQLGAESLEPILNPIQAALTAYEESIQLAANDPLLQAKVSLNLIRAMLKSNQDKPDNLINAFEEAMSSSNDPKLNKWINAFKNILLVRTLPDSYDKSFILISVIQLLQPPFAKVSFDDHPLHSPQQKTYLYEILSEAFQSAEVLNNDRLKAYAKGYLAQLYVEEQRYSEAIQLNQQAIFYAQSYPEILYHLEWQLGKLVNQPSELPKAIEIYRSAVGHLQSFHQRCRQVSDPSRQEAEQLYFELVELLLQPAVLESDNHNQSCLLEEARNHLESFKGAQLRNYFQDDCVTEKYTYDLVKEAQLQNCFQNDCKNKCANDLTDDLPKVEENTAVLYPIVFDDQIKLLLLVKNENDEATQIKLFHSKVEKESLREEIDKFLEEIIKSPKKKFEEQRKLIKEGKMLDFKGGIDDFINETYNKSLQETKKQAQQLYQWLIEPIAETLKINQIKILVIVPHSFLHALPFAALYNGQNFLIEENYALAIVPGLQFISKLKHESRQNIKTLFNGLSDDKEINVETQLTEMRNSLSIPASDTLIKEDFTVRKIKSRLENNSYAIVHFATHGRFRSDPNQTFLEVHSIDENISENKLRMNCLEALLGITEFRDQPVSLLTLSACETALGDEYAAFGLVGVAVKSGAHAALGTLWSVKPEPTSELITNFYKKLVNNSEKSKAWALQQAQLTLIKKGGRNQHPYFWAAFLLTGNWL
jgi:CHAT domain-containing protein